eukprot:scaffold136871_cov63-Phaeocystis_antarctica.AAC.5
MCSRNLWSSAARQSTSKRARSHSSESRNALESEPRAWDAWGSSLGCVGLARIGLQPGMQRVAARLESVRSTRGAQIDSSSLHRFEGASGARVADCRAASATVARAARQCLPYVESAAHHVQACGAREVSSAAQDARGGS